MGVSKSFKLPCVIIRTYIPNATLSCTIAIFLIWTKQRNITKKLNIRKKDILDFGHSAKTNPNKSQGQFLPKILHTSTERLKVKKQNLKFQLNYIHFVSFIFNEIFFHYIGKGLVLKVTFKWMKNICLHATSYFMLRWCSFDVTR